MFKSFTFVTCLCSLSFTVAASAAEPVKLEGHYAQGGTVRGWVEPGSSASLDGRALRIGKDGSFIFGFDRDHGASSTLRVVHADGEVEVRKFDIESREYNIERIDGLPPAKVSPRTQAQINHILRDQKMKRDSRKSPSQDIHFTETFMWPLTGRLSGFYGSQRILNGEPKRPHYGVDVAAPQDTNFYAPAGGVVTLASDDMYFEGGLIFLDHGLGYTSGFLHMTRVDVKPGDVVKKGDLLGGVGAAGRATGPHLDWRITWMGKQLDPTFLVPPMDEAMATWEADLAAARGGLNTIDEGTPEWTEEEAEAMAAEVLGEDEPSQTAPAGN